MLRRPVEILLDRCERAEPVKTPFVFHGGVGVKAPRVSGFGHPGRELRVHLFAEGDVGGVSGEVFLFERVGLKVVEFKLLGIEIYSYLLRNRPKR